jgi:hypothetical protein
MEANSIGATGTIGQNQGGTGWVTTPDSTLAAFDVQGTPVPEPANWGLVGIGFVGIVGLALRARAAAPGNQGCPFEAEKRWARACQYIRRTFQLQAVCQPGSRFPRTRARVAALRSPASTGFRQRHGGGVSGLRSLHARLG